MYLSLSDLGLSDDCPPGLVPQPGPLGHFACVPASLASQPVPVQQPAAAQTWSAPAAAQSVQYSASFASGSEVPGWVLACGALAAGYVAWHTWFRKPSRKRRKAA